MLCALLRETHPVAERDRISAVLNMFMGATGFDVETESTGGRPSGVDSLNDANKLTANTHQESLALAA